MQNSKPPRAEDGLLKKEVICTVYAHSCSVCFQCHQILNVWRLRKRLGFGCQQNWYNSALCVSVYAYFACRIAGLVWHDTISTAWHCIIAPWMWMTQIDRF